MCKLETIAPTKSYATEANAIAAVNRVFAKHDGGENLRYFIMRTNDGQRFFPVFIGESAIRAGVHFSFNVIG